jgi:3'-5' exoribonuclease
MKATFVSALAVGDTVDDIFALRKVELREFPTGRMIALELGDRTGRIKGVIWSGSAELTRSLISGRIYRVKGLVTTYKGENQVTVEKIEPSGEYEPKDFLPAGPIPLDELGRQLTEAINSIVDPHYNQLLTGIFVDTQLRSGFLSGVGGKLWHHNYIGGLAEHTLSVYGICRDFAERFAELDRDLILSGALLHDIGKVESYSLDNYIDYTDSGRLLGHIVIGDRIVTAALSSLPDFPSEKGLKIRHLVLSHQGSPQQSSPVPPMMAEGVALYIADLLDSKLAAFRRIRQKEFRPGVRWSSFVNLLDQYIYFGGDKESNGQEDI